MADSLKLAFTHPTVAARACETTDHDRKLKAYAARDVSELARVSKAKRKRHAGRKSGDFRYAPYQLLSAGPDADRRVAPQHNMIEHIDSQQLSGLG